MDINVKGQTAKKVELLDPAPAAPAVMTIKLLKHWTPGPDENVTVIGYRKPAVVVRRSEGGSYEAEPARFVQGEMAPPPVPGALNVSWSVEKGRHETYTKIWADTFVECDADKAYDLIEKGAAQVVRPG